MTFEKLPLDGPALIQLKKFSDNRGFFTERFRVDRWKEFAPNHLGFIQDNFSWSNYGVLRGLHFQFNPDQGKLVSCVSGKVTDVIVDIRPSSKTFGQHLKIDLDSEAPSLLWVPPGFAHSFVVTSLSGAGVLYKVDQPHNPNSEACIAWNDPELNIDWPIKDPILSARDAAAPSFADYRKSLKQ